MPSTKTRRGKYADGSMERRIYEKDSPTHIIPHMEGFDSRPDGSSTNTKYSRNREGAARANTRAPSRDNGKGFLKHTIKGKC